MGLLQRLGSSRYPEHDGQWFEIDAVYAGSEPSLDLDGSVMIAAGDVATVYEIADGSTLAPATTLPPTDAPTMYYPIPPAPEGDSNAGQIYALGIDVGPSSAEIKFEFLSSAIQILFSDRLPFQADHPCRDKKKFKIFWIFGFSDFLVV